MGKIAEDEVEMRGNADDLRLLMKLKIYMVLLGLTLVLSYRLVHVKECRKPIYGDCNFKPVGLKSNLDLHYLYTRKKYFKNYVEHCNDREK